MSRSLAVSGPLFSRLVDDAAVFPPGLAPMDVAVSEHLYRRTGPYAALLGPLVVPTPSAADLKTLAAQDDRTTDHPLEVLLVVRPGSPVDPLLEAVELLRDDERVAVGGLELGWSTGWRAVLKAGVPVSVEVGLGDDRATALDEIAAAVDDGGDAQAKFRTGATPEWAWPDEQTLAGFIDATVLRGLSFKLTGGLHHVVRGHHTEPMHGLLNVLLAVDEALDGAESPELADVLAVTDTELLVDRVSRLSPEAAVRLRGSFAAYGCCGVLDPLTELEALGLVTVEDVS